MHGDLQAILPLAIDCERIEPEQVTDQQPLPCGVGYQPLFGSQPLCFPAAATQNLCRSALHLPRREVDRHPHPQLRPAPGLRRSRARQGTARSAPGSTRRQTAAALHGRESSERRPARCLFCRAIVANACRSTCGVTVWELRARSATRLALFCTGRGPMNRRSFRAKYEILRALAEIRIGTEAVLAA